MTPSDICEGSASSDDKSLLIVEDDQTLLARLETAMRARGFVARTASSVEAGLALASAEPPAFAIVDLRLADGNGLDVLTKIRDARRDSRVVMMSGYGNIPSAVSAVKLGAFDFLPKPVDADEIMAALLTPSGSAPPPPEHPIGLDEKEWEHISSVLGQCSNNLSHAARQLSMHRRSLQRIVRRHE